MSLIDVDGDSLELGTRVSNCVNPEEGETSVVGERKEMMGAGRGGMRVLRKT